MRPVTSVNHAAVKSFRQLHRAKGRHAQQLFLLEGATSVSEALRSQYPIDTIACTPRFQAKHPNLARSLCQLPGLRTLLVTPDVLAKMASTESLPDDGIVASCPLRHVGDARSCTQAPVGIEVALQNPQDPGNFGTMLRNAAASGYLTLCLPLTSSPL